MNPKHLLLALVALAFIAVASLLAVPVQAKPAGLSDSIVLLPSAANALPASSATITVTTTADEFGTGAGCSLREAIQSANTNTDFGGCTHTGTYGDDTIVVPSGTYTITIDVGGTEDLNTEGDLDINSSLTISGAGAGSTIINGNGTTTFDRVFHITGAYTVTISGVTIRNGASDGAGIYNHNGNLTISSSVLSNNGVFCAGGGGGILNDGGAVTITSSTLSNNCVGGGGGGLYNSSGTVTIAGSTVIAGNVANTGGGIDNSFGGNLSVSSSTISLNQAYSAGGIQNNGTMTVTNTTINGNLASMFSDGGGVYNDSSGTMTIINSTLSANTTGHNGGAIYNNGDLSISSSTIITNNRALTSGSAGGGIYNALGKVTLSSSIIISNSADLGGGIRNAGTITLNTSTLNGNTALTYGGGMYNVLGTASITGSSVMSNTTTSGLGAGIANGSMMTITASVISGNQATDPSSGDGGGIFNFGTLTVTNSTIRNNTSNGLGGGGGILNSFGYTITLSSSTVSGNAANNSMGNGGGISNSGTLTVTNSTISGNWAKNWGGGIRLNVGSAGLNNLTITGNIADSDNDGFGDGGGLSYGGGTINNLSNTIIAGNIDNGSGGSFQAPDCTGAPPSVGYNIIGNNTGCFFSGTTGDQVGTGGSPINPKLGALANYSGPTLTHALLPGSPAIDAGNPAAPGSGGNACLATDQRGVTRPVGLHCDIGAFEGTIYPLYLPLIEK